MAITTTGWPGFRVAKEQAWRRLWRSVLGALALVLLVGCADTGYYWQSVSGHLQLMQAARPVEQWLVDPQTTPVLRQRLELSQRMRAFAVTTLDLPDNPSYHRYADLHRNAVVWNVVAAPPLSLKLKTWCFPVLGCVSYRGYFDESEARREAAALQAQGLEVSVYGVPAYSTLGWMNWAGGDPLLNTFIGYPEGELARLLFHELAHQVLYARDDTTFNESFATTVERLGGAMWLQRHGSTEARTQYVTLDMRRREFRALALSTRTRLQQVYAQRGQVADDVLRTQKQAVMQDFRDQYARLKQQWGGYAGYDPWVAEANNASLGAQAAYDSLVPQFEALFVREGRDWKAFYHAVKRIAKLPVDARKQALLALGPESEPEK
ncbi:MAG: aminopeptidase [Burkholderiaceae bacterium]